MGDQSKWAIVWLDGFANDDSPSNQAAKTKFTQLCKTLKVFTDATECDNFVKTYRNESIILIVSGRLSREIIPQHENTPIVSAFFLYCMDEGPHIKWAKQFKKIKGIHIVMDDLIANIRLHQSQHTASLFDENDNEETSNSVLNALETLKSTDSTYILLEYIKLPIFSLENTTEILKPFVHQITEMVQLSKTGVKTSTDNLTTDQSAAITLLTLTWKTPETSFIHILNKTLSTENSEKLKPWIPYLRLLFSALSKLENVERYLHHAVHNQSYDSKFLKSYTITFWQFIFCVLNIEDIRSENEFSVNGSRTLLSMTCKTAKDITKYAKDPSKPVIILPPGRTFHVGSTLNAGNGLHFSQIHEIKPIFEIE